MKKQLLCLVLLVLIIPFSSFAPVKKAGVVRHKELKQTDWLVGYFDQNGHTFEVWGDNQGGSSGNVVALYDESSAPVSFSSLASLHRWGNDYGPGSDGLGVTIKYTYGATSPTYSGWTYY